MIAIIATLYLPTGSHAWTVNPSKFGVFLLAYPLLWLGAHLPFSWVGSRNDYSYGVYIYGYPLTQLLISFGAVQLGFWAFMGLTGSITLALGVASWWLVEKHALRLKRISLGRPHLFRQASVLRPVPPASGTLVGEVADAEAD
jgi:hypothetical protein